jgi:hypothetical protein
MSSQRYFVFFIVILVLICLWLGYQIVDQSVTLDHQAQHAEVLKEQRDLLVEVFNTAGKDISEISVRNFLARLPANSVFEKDANHIVAGQVSFYFSEGKLVRVKAGN